MTPARPWSRARDALIRRLGGARQARLVLLPAGVLALNSADVGVIGAIVGELRHSLGIGNTQVGILTAFPAAVGAVATLPVGQLADRVPRVPLLAGSIVLWSVAMIMGGLADSYAWLLASRVALGAVTATAGRGAPHVRAVLRPAPLRRRAGRAAPVLPLVGLGSLAGVLAGGRLADRLMRRGFLTARIVVPGVGYAVSALLFVPGLLTREPAGRGLGRGVGTADGPRRSRAVR
ncbi:MFS transporter [Actinomadura viridis]|uniref:MFS transporter n=1 Tax=Actinomadura viridis TaxID=58110 RepID=UPI003676C4A3